MVKSTVMANRAALGEIIKNAPAAFDAEAAGRFRDHLGARLAEFSDDERALLSGVAGCSPYLNRLMLRAPALTLATLRRSPEDSLKSACEAARTCGASQAPEAQMRALRRAKDEAALGVALADIAGAWDVMTAARALSEFADAALAGAVDAAAKTCENASLSVIAMGKLGAKELNYSSDIDLIVLFEDGEMTPEEGAAAQKTAVQVTRRMIALMQTQTPDGYVFRTDLRLRPDPGVSPVALSFAAAESYYESFGQNWERMAFIKARAAAGDMARGENFLRALRPFVWRKFLDFAAIEDVRAVKRQIDTAKGGGVEFRGRDIKLGRGGIREVEFFVQTQQLILGGKNAKLRERATLDALAALHANGRVSVEERAALDGAYRYLRHVEHRLQMINDEQTHCIPKRRDSIERLATFLGENSANAFREELEYALDAVCRHYDRLFATQPAQDGDVGALIFTGVDSDPETIATLQGLGFRRAEDIAARIREWRAGGVRATRSNRARQLLTTLMPALLNALANAGEPDDAFFAFARFMERLPAGVQLFALLANNLEAFDTLIRLMTFSPYLGRELSEHINFVEHIIEKGVAAPPPPVSSYALALNGLMARAQSYEDALNIVRRWAGEQKFLIAAQLAVDALPAPAAARHFTAIAEACVSALAPVAAAETQRRYGEIEGALAVVALGRLGGEEMTAASDLDLIFIYDSATQARADGARALTSTEYFTRLVRRLITALSAATEEGGLYDVDMQLRPSGASGPAAVSMAAFRRYYAEEAWTWEIMALTKARVIGPRNGLSTAAEEEIENILQRKRARADVAEDVNEMRSRLLKARPTDNLWNVKHVFGGLTDIAFICQFLGLVSAAKHGRPPAPTGAAIDWLGAIGALSEQDCAALSDAYGVFEAILHASRAATGGVFDRHRAGEALKKRMASICGAGAIEEAEGMLAERQARVAEAYGRVIGRSPAVPS